jgi:chromosome segregation ATPase
MKNENNDLTLDSQIQASGELLNRLQAELADIPNRMTLAVEDADSASMISLRNRQNDLPVEIHMTRLRLEQIRLRLKEQTLPSLDAEIETLHKPIPALEKAYNEAKSALDAARFVHTAAIDSLRFVKQEISDEKRMIEQLKHQKV